MKWIYETFTIYMGKDYVVISTGNKQDPAIINIFFITDSTITSGIKDKHAFEMMKH